MVQYSFIISIAFSRSFSSFLLQTFPITRYFLPYVAQPKYRRTESNILDILLVIIRRNYDNASIAAINTGYLFQVLQILFTFFFQKHDFRHQLHMPIFAQECIDYNTGIQVGTSIKITVHNCLSWLHSFFYSHFE